MSLKAKIFLGFSISILIIFSLFSFYTFRETTETIIEKEEKELNALSNSIYGQMKGQLDISEVSALSLANNREIQKLFYNRDRDGLAEMLLPAYESISKDIKQIQFHLPNSDSFLRLHKPEKYGDSLKDFRFTVNQANKDKKIVRGLEEGVAGFGFRVVVPVDYEGTHIGTVEYGSDFGQAFLNNLKDNYDGEYSIYQFGEKGLIASTIEEDNWDINESEYIDGLKTNEVQYLQSKNGNYNITLAPFKDYQGDVVGYFKIINDRSELVKDLKDIKRNGFIIVVVILLFALALFYMFLNRSLKPINNLMEITKKVADGDLTQNIEMKNNDEIGKLGNTFNAMVLSLKDLISKSSEVSEQVAATSEELSAASEEVTASAEQVSNTISGVASSAKLQTNSIDQSNVDINDMVDNIKEVTSNIDSIDDANKKTLDSAQKGINSSKDAVQKINDLKISTQQTSEDIDKLNHSSKEIEEIVSTISQIAEQTNLLALNAAIEAARAGEDGKGFSVVAEEVRKLAEESSKSSKQISDLIQSIQNQIEYAVKSMKMNIKNVDDSVEIVNKSSMNFSEIMDGINNVSNQTKDVLRLTKDVFSSSISVEENFNIVVDISDKNLDSIESVASNSEQQTAAIEEIASSAMDLATLASELRDSISTFKY